MVDFTSPHVKPKFGSNELLLVEGTSTCTVARDCQAFSHTVTFIVHCVTYCRLRTVSARFVSPFLHGQYQVFD